MTLSNLVSLMGIVQSGHQVASGFAKNSPYSQGTIAMQLPFFLDLGLDLREFFQGTLNISIAPYNFKITKPQYTFEGVKWHPDYDEETFSFSPCQVVYQDSSYQGWVYYPHPETKIGHFQDKSVVEVLAPKISNLNYGSSLILKVNPQQIQITSAD